MYVYPAREGVALPKEWQQAAPLPTDAGLHAWRRDPGRTRSVDRPMALARAGLTRARAGPDRARPGTAGFPRRVLRVARGRDRVAGAAVRLRAADPRRPGDLAAGRVHARAGRRVDGRGGARRAAGRVPACQRPAARAVAGAGGRARAVRAADGGGGPGVPDPAAGRRRVDRSCWPTRSSTSRSSRARSRGLWAHTDRRAEDAARALGASRPRTFTSVVLPQLAPAIGSAAAIVFQQYANCKKSSR